MKPLEAAGYLRIVLDAVSTDERIRPHVRTWFCVATSKRLCEPSSDLDHLLGLRSNAGGRLTLGCTIPDRDKKLCDLAKSLNMPKLKDRAEEILRLKDAGKLVEIESLGKLPKRRRLQDIIRNAK